MRLIGGGEEGESELNGWAVRGQVITWHRNGGAEKFRIAAGDGVGSGAALPVNGAA